MLGISMQPSVHLALGVSVLTPKDGGQGCTFSIWEFYLGSSMFLCPSFFQRAGSERKVKLP